MDNFLCKKITFFFLQSLSNRTNLLYSGVRDECGVKSEKGVI